MAHLLLFSLLQSGDVIILLRSVDDDWIVGQTSKQEGMFPRSFIKVKIPLQGEVRLGCLFVWFNFQHVKIISKLQEIFCLSLVAII